jgi:hypothetical protein
VGQAMILSMVIGSSRIRLPVAWNTAFATAAAAPTIPHPRPDHEPQSRRVPRAGERRYPRHRRDLRRRAPSSSAAPIPITTPPRIWLRAVLRLRILPAAMALTTRVTSRRVPRAGERRYPRHRRDLRRRARRQGQPARRQALTRRDGSGDDLVDGDRQLADPLAGGVEHRVRHCRRRLQGAGPSGLALRVFARGVPPMDVNSVAAGEVER